MTPRAIGKSGRLRHESVSLATVAQDTGVSVATVSRIVNGKNGRASAETVARVAEAIERLGYRPSPVGRALRRRTSRVVAMLSPNLDNPAMAAIAVFAHNPVFAFIALTVAVVGTMSAIPVFWQLPSLYVSGTAAAAGVAMINSIANLAGFGAPYAMGVIKDTGGTLSAGLLGVAVIGVGLGALAVGAVSIGAMAIGRLAVGRLRVGRLDVGHLTVRRLTVLQKD